MPRILVLYYSRSRNTEKMAKAIVNGAKTVEGVEVELNYYVPAETLSSFDAIVIGAPTYYHDMNLDMKKLFEEAATKNVDLKGKIGAAFGSYGWSGEAPRLVLEVLKNKFGMNVSELPLLIRYEPDEAGEQKCIEFGRKIAEKLMHMS